MTDWSQRDLRVVRGEIEDCVRDRPHEGVLHRELFALYAVLGEWDRCRGRLDVIRELEPERLCHHASPARCLLRSRPVACGWGWGHRVHESEWDRLDDEHPALPGECYGRPLQRGPIPRVL